MVPPPGNRRPGTICPPAASTPPCSPPAAGGASRKYCCTRPRTCCSEAQGDADLRAAIAQYLAAYRGVSCTPEQVVVGAGIEYLLGCVAHLFAGSCAAVENPGYTRSRTILENNGIPCRLVDIDRHGLPAEGLEACGANLC